MPSKPLDLLTISSVIAAALAEDIGPGDITSQLLIPEAAQAEMRFVAREDMVACGTFIPAEVYSLFRSPLEGEQTSASLQDVARVVGGCQSNDERPLPLRAASLRDLRSAALPQGEGKRSVQVETLVTEGRFVKPGTVLAIASGNARVLLAGERVALNLMQRLCGVATLTKRYVDAVASTKAVILDTRKTMPGLRALDKYAVKTGGGQNHRMGLWDAVLVKDNHLALSGEWRVTSGEALNLAKLIKDIRKKLSFATRHSPLATIIIECDTLSQLEEALAAKPDRILLDNMDVQTMRKAVAMTGGKIPLEASGGASLETIRAIAETGVDYISVGKLTHSAPAVDIGADIGILL